MVRFILLLLSLTVFAEVGRSQSTPPNKGSGPERVKPVVNVQVQPGTPLKIAQVETKWATPDQQVLEIYVRVENVGDLEIPSYVWRIDKADGSQDKDGCFTHTIHRPIRVLNQVTQTAKAPGGGFPLVVQQPPSIYPSILSSLAITAPGDSMFVMAAENLSPIIRTVPLVTPTDRFVTNFNFASGFAIKQKLEKCHELKSHGRVISNRPDCNLNLR